MRSVVAVGVAVTVAAALTAGLSGGAEAVVNTWVTRKMSAFDSEPAKQATAACPAGTRVYGGGGEVTPGDAKVMLVGLVPKRVDGVDKFTARAVASAAFPETRRWSVTAYAICGPPLPVMATVQQLDSGQPGDRDKIAIAGCQGGLVPIGAGGEILQGQGGVSFRLINPVTFPGQVAVAAHEDQLDGRPTPRNFRVRAYAICTVPRPQHVSATGDEARGGDSPAEASITCRWGTSLHAPGAVKSDVDGHAYLNAVVPDPTTRLGAFVRAAPPTPGARPWILDTAVVCAD